MTQGNLSKAEAASALAGIHASEARLAQRAAVCPPWLHAVFGLMFFGLIGAIAVSHGVQMIASAVMIVVAVVLIRRQRQRGLFITGLRRDRTLPITLVMIGLALVLVVAALHMRDNDFSTWSKLALATIAGALFWALSVLRMRVFLHQLTRDAA